MTKSLVCLPGIAGSTGSTAVATIWQLAEGESPLCTTSGPAFSDLGLLEPHDFEFMGWDYVGLPLAEAVARCGIAPVPRGDLERRLQQLTPHPGLRTSLDIPAETTHVQEYRVTDPIQAVAAIEEQIRSAAITVGADHACVIYLGSPYAIPPQSMFDPRAIVTWDDLSALGGEVSSGLLYGLAAARAGADFVDFTPGRSLYSPLLIAQAVEGGTQVAGSDGSTGQTMLKHALADLFRSRGMKLKAWYSTNVIGNHDGFVLSLPQHRVAKIADKTQGLSAILNGYAFDHTVTIDYVPEWGDAKESWDAIELAGWGNSNISLRVDWRGMDSMLASAMIFDIVRLMRLGHQRGRVGMRHDLGYFFKHPIGRLGRTPAELYNELLENVTGYNADE